MPRSLSEPLVEAITKVVVTVLFAIVLVAAVFQVREDGIAALPALLPSLLLTLVVAVGVLTDSLDSPILQVGFGVALLAYVAFGLIESSLIAALVALSALAIVGANLRRVVGARE